MNARLAPRNPWLWRYGSSGSGKRVRLLCLPHAGGAAAVFREWHALLPPPVEVCAVELPGRGSRLREQPLREFGALVDATLAGVRPALDRPFALFGHSMGALLAFELACRLSAEGLAPCQLFVSGRPAPHLESLDPPIHMLPEPEFVERLRTLNGTPLEVFRYPELMELMIPILRADLGACESYVHTPRPPLEVPISAFGGMDDREVSGDRLEAWSRYTRARFVALQLPGDHFFLNEPPSRERLTRSLSADLSRACGLSSSSAAY